MPLGSICRFVQDKGGGDAAAGWIAAQQLGLVTARQLHAAGIGRGAIPSRRTRGLLRPMLRGVYLVGSAPPVPGASELAALLACGPRSLISHRSAAALWRIATPATGPVHVTVIGDGRKQRAGLVLHRTDRLDPADRAVRNGIRVTSPARTLVDFAAQASGDELGRALSEIYALRLASERQVKATIDRSPHRAGVGILRAYMADLGGPVITRSKAERRLRRLLESARLPTPLSNTSLAAYEPDLLWPQHRLIVEFDGYAVHGHRTAFERDRRRDADLVAAGYRVIRVTWRQLEHEPFAVVANIAGALNWGPGRPPG